MTRLLPPKECKIYTPHVLAAGMVSALCPARHQIWLEPSCGKGVFLKILRSNGILKSNIVGVDLDSTPHANDRCGSIFRKTDFLTWAKMTSLRFDRIVGNPPYISLSKVHPQIRRAALESNYGQAQVSDTANTWVAFLTASLNLMKVNGCLTFVLPAAWDFADYARGVRDIVRKSFGNVEVHRCLKPLFDDAQDGSVVIVCKRFGQPSKTFSRYVHSDIHALVNALKSSEEAAPKQFRQVHKTVPNHVQTSLFSEVFDIRIGAVTGDANFFLLRRAQVKALGLPNSSLIPILTKANHLRWYRITKQTLNKLVKKNERVWLFSPRTTRALGIASVTRYLRKRAKTGGCNRNSYKVSIREKWFEVPFPGRIDAFMSGMSSTGPWLCLNAVDGLIASNTLYVVRSRKHLTKNQRAGWALSFLSKYSRTQLSARGRVYAQGLLKYEPNDIARIRLINPASFANATKVYRECVTRLIRGDGDEAIDLATSWLVGGYD